jgi:hypothetical protein
MADFSATICFIDPIVHYMGGKVDMNRANEVREVVGALHQAAMRTHTALVIVGHSRKGSEGHDWERAMGSADFINATRSVLYAAKTNEGTRVMRHVKSNYAAEGPALEYTFGDHKFEWLDTYDEGALVVTTNGGARTDGRTFLRQLLAHGPVLANEVKARAQDEGISLTTHNRAKEGIARSLAQRQPDGRMAWVWELVGGTA